MSASESDNGDSSSGLAGWGDPPTRPSTGGWNSLEVPTLETPNYGLTTEPTKPEGLTAPEASPLNSDGSYNYGFNTGGWSSGGQGLSLDVDQDSSQVSLSGLSPAGLTQDQVDSWADMSPTYQQSFNAARGLPGSEVYNYNHTSPGWREALTNATNPTGSGKFATLMRDLGVRGMGVTPDQYLSNETDTQRDKRMGLVADGVNRMGQLAINMAPGGGMVMTAAKAIDAVQNKGMSPFEAFKAAAFDIGGSQVAGRVNGLVGKALGPELSQALGTYNRFGSLANLAMPGIAPGINPGSMAVSAARKAFDVPSLGRPSGVTRPDGAPIVSVGGWATNPTSSSSSSSSEILPILKPAAPESPAASLVGLDTNIRFSLSDLVKRYRALAQK